MKFFLDTANIEEIREAAAMGFLDGATTNPSLVAKTGKKFRQVAEEICAAVDGPVSLEVVSTEYDGMMAEARDLAKIAKNVVIKLPLTRDGLKATKSLSADGTRVNVTLCFAPLQALFAAKAGAAYISPFVGRLDDRGQDGMEVVQQIRTIYDNFGFSTEILVASVRHPIHVLQAALMGADVATMPFDVFGKMIQHPLTDSGLQQFLKDWQKVPR